MVASCNAADFKIHVDPTRQPALYADLISNVVDVEIGPVHKQVVIQVPTSLFDYLKHIGHVEGTEFRVKLSLVERRLHRANSKLYVFQYEYRNSIYPIWASKSVPSWAMFGREPLEGAFRGY